MYVAESGIHKRITPGGIIGRQCDHISRDVDTQSVVEFVRAPALEALVVRPDLNNLLTKPRVVLFDELEELVEVRFQYRYYFFRFVLLRNCFGFKISLQVFLAVAPGHRGSDFDLQQ